MKEHKASSTSSPPPPLFTSLCHQGATGGGAPAPGKPQGESRVSRGAPGEEVQLDMLLVQPTDSLRHEWIAAQTEGKPREKNAEKQNMMLTQNILQSSNKEQRGSSQAPSVRQVINLRLTEQPHVRQNFYGDFFMHTANTYPQLRKYTKDDDMIYQPDQVTLSVNEGSTKVTLCKEDTGSSCLQTT